MAKEEKKKFDPAVQTPKFAMLDKVVVNKEPKMVVGIGMDTDGYVCFVQDPSDVLHINNAVAVKEDLIMSIAAAKKLLDK